MPRRFALLLVALLVFLAGALFVARSWRARRSRLGAAAPVAVALPTPAVPPTPLPARRVTLYFESGEDERLHPEVRDLPAMADDIALLRAVGSAVLEGPRTPGLLRPFPEGWRVRAAFRLADGLAFFDLEPPRPKKDEGDAAPPPPARWETGSWEELSAAQSLIVSANKNIPGLSRFYLLLGGEPVETLAGHLDLSHPLAPDLTRVVEEAAVPPAPPTPSPTEVLSPRKAPIGPPRRADAV